MTDKREKATKVKCKRDESITKQSIFMEYPDVPPRETSTSGEERGETAVFAGFFLVCYTAVFSVVTQRGGALRDDTKNGCVAD